LDEGWSWAALDREGGLLHLGLSPQGSYRLPLRLDQLSPELIEAFVRVEDRWFYWHPGINPLSILRAAGQNLQAGGIRSGASTLTMQLARLIEPRPRTFGAKLLQAWRALQLEARYSKRQILEFYLSRVPMGGNLEGVGAAAWLYFGKSPRDISAGESALLVALPRSPNLRRPDRDPARARAGRARVLQRLAGNLPAAWRGQDPASAAVPTKRLPNPQRAPHLLDYLAPRLRQRPGLSRLTLDPALQGLAETRLAARVELLAKRGVRHGAVIIVDNRDRSVLAYVGSPQPGSADAGQVNGANLLRSPGSSLKPFLYGLAIDQGLITPKTVLFDIPRDYGGYKPVNYKGGYAGPVAAQDCLIRSLNTPAVWLESQLVAKGQGLLALHRRLGLARERQGQSGLSAVLGALPLTLEELVRLYAGLADGGRLRDLRYFSDEALAPVSATLFSPESAYLVAQMLGQGQRPDLPSSWEFTATRGRVAFKTGTSFGFRDAWCLAYSPTYTVGVWLGNADAKGSSALVGGQAAAPLALDLMNQLLRNRDEWFKRPAGLLSRRVCAETGLPLGPFCPQSDVDDYLPGRSSGLACRVHRQVWVRKRDAKRVAPDCMSGPASAYQQRLVEAWPVDVARYLRSFGGRTLPYPAAADDCPSVAALAPPRFVSPLPRGSFELKAALPLSQQRLALSAQASADVERLYWFVDGLLVAEGGPAEQCSWQARPGKHAVSVVDSEGRTAQTEIQVTGLSVEKKVPEALAPDLDEVPVD
jgi:penicillin-binding protein 1C